MKFQIIFVEVAPYIIRLSLLVMHIHFMVKVLVNFFHGVSNQFAL